MEYVVVRCGCGTVEQVPVHPTEDFVRFETTTCAACLVQKPSPSCGGLLGLLATTLGGLVGLSQWVLLGKQPRTGRR